MSRPPRRVPIAAAAIIALLAVPANRAGASEDLDKEMTVVAKQIKLLLDQKGQDSIAVGEFRGPAKLASSAGPAITKALEDELKKIGVACKRRAELEVNGEYRDVDDQKSKLMTVQITAHVVDRSGVEVVAFEPRGVFNVATIASLLGVTVALPADAKPEARSEKLAEAVDKPQVHLASTRISAAADSPFAVEVLVKVGADFRPRAATRDDDGFAFLKIKRGETYGVRLINDSANDAAVTLTVDGLSVFAFSGNKAYTHYIVPSKGSLTVPGWHRTNAVSDSFQVGEYAKSAVAEKLPSSASIGTITAGFAAAWPKDGPPPEDEPSASKVPGGRSVDATVKGPPVNTNFTEVVRKTGLLRASVSVRYTKEAEPKNLPDSKP